MFFTVASVRAIHCASSSTSEIPLLFSLYAVHGRSAYSTPDAKRGNILECCATSCHSTTSRNLAVFPSLLSPSTHLVTHHARPRRDRREPVSSLILLSRMLTHTRSICSRTSEGNSSGREDETGSIRQNSTKGERFVELYHTFIGRLSTQPLGRRTIGTLADQMILRNPHFRGTFVCLGAVPYSCI